MIAERVDDFAAVDARLMQQPRGTCERWPGQPSWWRVRGTHSCYGVRGPEDPAGVFCPCPGFKYYGSCAHVSAVRAQYASCLICGSASVTEMTWTRGAGYLIVERCVGLCGRRKVIG